MKTRIIKTAHIMRRRMLTAAVLLSIGASGFADDPSPAVKPAASKAKPPAGANAAPAASKPSPAPSLPVANKPAAIQNAQAFMAAVQKTDGVDPGIKQKAKQLSEAISKAPKESDAIDAIRSGIHEMTPYLAGTKMSDIAPEGRTQIRNAAAGVSNSVGQYDDAVQLAQAVLDQSPDNRDALNQEARGQYGIGNYEAAIRHAMHLAELDPKSDESYTTQALAYYGEGNYLQAKEDSERALALNKNNEIAFAVLKMAQSRIHPIKLHLNAQQLAVAKQVEDEYEGAVRQANQVETGRLPEAASLAASKFQLKDYWGAIEEATKAIAINPKDGEAYYFRAAARNMLGMYQMAAEDASMAISRQPGSSAAYDARAMALNRLGRPNEALADSMQALSLSGADAYAYANRAESFEALGEFSAMLEDYRQASRLNPQFEPVYKKAAKRHAIPIALMPEKLAAETPKANLWRNRQFLLTLASGVLGLLLIALGCWHLMSQSSSGAKGSQIPAGYKLIRTLGEGGMGIVYEAEDLALGRRVAIKKLKESEKGRLEKLLEEARTVAALRHPNIVEIHSVVENDGDVFLVFELIDGRPLGQILASHGALTFEQAYGIMRDICGALEYAHRHNVIHRDLKPSNIMITQEGAAKIMDFGVARHFTRYPSGVSTQRVVGTPSYMAPEAEQGVIRKESDVFALGACLFEMLAGNKLYPEDSAAALKLTRGYVKLSWQKPGLPRALDALIDEAVHPHPDRRIGSAAEFFARLDQIANPVAI